MGRLAEGRGLRPSPAYCCLVLPRILAPRRIVPNRATTAQRGQRVLPLVEHSQRRYSVSSIRHPCSFPGILVVKACPVWQRKRTAHRLL